MTQHHRQHIQLSESAKQMLEELTSQRYPGKGRRQSQVIEDLILAAFQHGQQQEGGRSQPENEASQTFLQSEKHVGNVVAETRVPYQPLQLWPVEQGCPICQCSIQAIWNYCRYCGYELRKACSQCGEFCSTDRELARFCYVCGARL
ncbi:zinc ribbon domain-containing protein [Tengunoibacter tsumagoiensis]|uniref:DZANK-type domain-containing protein n=1 Tax=Tengunoibacter tsumagoiensis TaxID=2014871 RepID=A0A401ZYH2_9CHLR|nr:zinc ribbon domain-containing protein [Tengunoibacter tsumagoiensis]GCE11891.1 hypothetical protein KTT_17500 [Tengunoibacter tsumagoiensis]